MTDLPWIPHVPVETDVTFKAHFTREAFEAAVLSAGEPSEPGPSINLGRNDLEALMVRWGWCPAVRATSIWWDGIYGDWTWVEDDERLFAALAPLIVDGSYIVFRGATLKKPPGDWYGIHESDRYEVWEFRDGEVSRKPAEQTVGYEW